MGVESYWDLNNILKSRSYMTNGKNVARDFMIQIVYCPLQFVTPIILFLILETNNFFCTFFFVFEEMRYTVSLDKFCLKSRDGRIFKKSITT